MFGCSYNFFLFYFFLLEKQTLPPGVTQKDVNLYKDIREKAAQTVTEILSQTPKVNIVQCTPGTSISPSATMAAQERCPAGIEFGKWEIDTWYSSPFPQEYAR